MPAGVRRLVVGKIDLYITMRLFIVPPGADAPAAAPTVDSGEVHNHQRRPKKYPPPEGCVKDLWGRATSATHYGMPDDT